MANHKSENYMEILARILFALFLLLFVLSKEVNAFPPPDVVFRFDSRSPTDIFQNGFSSWGLDADLLRHVSGESINNRSSAYISTTSNWISIEQMARTLMLPDSIAYVYSIRPTENFYDISGSLLHANMQNINRDRLLRQSLGLYRNYAWQEEFAAYRQIQNTQIMYAQTINRDQNGHITISPVHVINAHYVTGIPIINGSYLDIVDNNINNNYYLGDIELNPVSAAFGLDGCTHYLKSDTSTCKVEKMEDVTNFVNRALIYVASSNSWVRHSINPF